MRSGDVGPVEAALLGVEAATVGRDRAEQERAQHGVLLARLQRRRLVRHKRARRAGGRVDTPRAAIVAAGVEVLPLVLVMVDDATHLRVRV